MASRPYRQRRRAESAEQTRTRILDALDERLRTAPGEPVGVDEVARQAGVSRATVYLAFGSRSGLFDALTERLLQGSGQDRLAEAVRDPDARSTLRRGIAATAELYAANREVLRVVYAMGRLDPEGVGRAIARSERRRSASMDWLVGRLREQRLLRDDTNPAYAGHLLWVLTSFETFDLLSSGRGLTTDAVVEVLLTTARSTLLDDPG